MWNSLLQDPVDANIAFFSIFRQKVIVFVWKDSEQIKWNLWCKGQVPLSSAEYNQYSVMREETMGFETSESSSKDNYYQIREGTVTLWD